MKEENGKKGTENYEYKEATLEETKEENKNEKMWARTLLSIVLGSTFMICSTIIIHKYICSGSVC